MRINNIGYLLKEGVKGIFLHGFMSFAAVCVTVACLLIMGSFSVLMYNVNIMVEELNKTNEVMAYVDSELPDAEAKSIGTKINRIENVHKSEFVDRETALERFVADHSDEQESFAGLVPEDLRHRFVVTLEDNEPRHCQGPGGFCSGRRLHHIAEGTADRLRGGHLCAVGGVFADYFQHRQAGHV